MSSDAELSSCTTSPGIDIRASPSIQRAIATLIDLMEREKAQTLTEAQKKYDALFLEYSEHRKATEHATERFLRLSGPTEAATPIYEAGHSQLTLEHAARQAEGLLQRLQEEQKLRIAAQDILGRLRGILSQYASPGNVRRDTATSAGIEVDDGEDVVTTLQDVLCRAARTTHEQQDEIERLSRAHDKLRDRFRQNEAAYKQLKERYDEKEKKIMELEKALNTPKVKVAPRSTSASASASASASTSAVTVRGMPTIKKPNIATLKKTVKKPKFSQSDRCPTNTPKRVILKLPDNPREIKTVASKPKRTIIRAVRDEDEDDHAHSDRNTENNCGPTTQRSLLGMDMQRCTSSDVAFSDLWLSSFATGSGTAPTVSPNPILQPDSSTSSVMESDSTFDQDMTAVEAIKDVILASGMLEQDPSHSMLSEPAVDGRTGAPILDDLSSNRYCICGRNAFGQVSYLALKMIACEGPFCQRRWQITDSATVPFAMHRVDHSAS
ncbi:hypothetical protein GLOTRDRAFT_95748 [Gloeophyllum trabeum ATCC 11539]|uniref:Uncharacterized protein n=1 Tax=Gloeophyllum trabeum (strain ATCC 11539 / FP-39264 / Madison 617) TaxID=670483 RepID=S7PXP2_GLOTA|nr:uncharacterized protein GLOTRDRAFT_95748 [Gloeophyllum trabeum ATCC 11539]EPQ52072.1 hypothetical protein GLOTRDRAFT_95748 [Gloeophyllum trabeum ATCC 11539]